MCALKSSACTASGSGKSSLLKALGNREVPIPEHVDTYFLDRLAHMQHAHKVVSLLYVCSLVVVLVRKLTLRFCTTTAHRLPLPHAEALRPG